MDRAAHFQGFLPIRVHIVFQSRRRALRGGGRALLQNVLLGTPPAASLVVGVEALNQGLFRHPLQAQIERGVDS